MPIKANMTGVSAEGLGAIVGLHEAKVVECKTGTSQNGNPKVDFTFEITEGEYEGRKAWKTHGITPQSLWALKGTLLALGISEEDLQGEIEIDEEELIGLECAIRCRKRMYEGREQTDVTQVLPPGASSFVEEQSSPDDLI